MLPRGSVRLFAAAPGLLGGAKEVVVRHGQLGGLLLLRGRWRAAAADGRIVPVSQGLAHLGLDEGRGVGDAVTAPVLEEGALVAGAACLLGRILVGGTENLQVVFRLLQGPRLLMLRRCRSIHKVLRSHLRNLQRFTLLPCLEKSRARRYAAAGVGLRTSLLTLLFVERLRLLVLRPLSRSRFIAIRQRL